MTAVALALLFTLMGCEESGGDDSRPGPPDAAARLGLYERAEGIFSAAHLMKPAADADEDAVRLAPLLMLEAGDASGTVLPDDALTVYYERTDVEIDGRTLARWTYLWLNPSSAGESRPQGIRMTLRADGFPAIFEVLRDSSGAQPVFVSTTLESQAADRLGPPLPGRSFSIEPPVEDAPRLVVPGLLEPGPMPLGPFVYVTEKTNDVATIICRCMPSQVESVIESSEYRLEPLGNFPKRFDRPQVVLRLAAPS